MTNRWCTAFSESDARLEVEIEVTDSTNYTRFAVLTGMNVRYGQTPNDMTIFVPYTDSEDTSVLPFPFYVNPITDMLCVSIYSSDRAFSARHYMSILSVGITKRGEQRGVTYKLVDFMRGYFLNQHPIMKQYNSINQNDVFETESRSEQYFGIWYTNSNGELTYETLTYIWNPNLTTGTIGESYSLMDAYRAIIDIFYTPMRVHNLQGSYPNLVFSDQTLIDELQTFIIHEVTFKPSDQISAILTILRQLGDSFDVFAWGEGFGVGNQYLLITKKGRGPQFVGYETPKNEGLADYVYNNHLPDGYETDSSVVILKDESKIDASKQIDCVCYMGAPREYLAKGVPLIPAWDWWNDYSIIVRQTSNNQIIPLKDPSNPNQINPAYPQWLIPWAENFEDLSLTFGDIDVDQEEKRLYLLNTISVLWGGLLYDLMDAYKYNAEKMEYTVNLMVMDALYINPQLPMHQHRFKRYIAAKLEPDATQLPTTEPEDGWDSPAINRYRYILPTLIDGKRHDIEDVYLSNLLSKTDTYKLSIPPIVEGHLPDYTKSTGDATSGMVDFELEWRQLDSVTLDNEFGYFLISQPAAVSVYFDKSSVRDYTGVQPFNYKNAKQINEYIIRAKAELHTQRKKAYYTMPLMRPDSGGPRGVRIVDSAHIPFRTTMRATFYYNKPEKHMENEGYDEIHYDPVFNDVYLAGIYPDSFGWPGTESRIHYLVDNKMRYQSNEDSWTSSPDPEITILQPEVIQNRRYESGRVTMDLGWTHIRDHEKIREKAIRIYNELRRPLVGGFVHLPEMLGAGAANHVMIGTTGGWGLGTISLNNNDMPISEVSHSFPTIKATVGFDFQLSRIGESFDPDLPIKIRATEHFKTLEEAKRQTDQPKKETGIFTGSSTDESEIKKREDSAEEELKFYTLTEAELAARQQGTTVAADAPNDKGNIVMSPDIPDVYKAFLEGFAAFAPIDLDAADNGFCANFATVIGTDTVTTRTLGEIELPE